MSLGNFDIPLALAGYNASIGSRAECNYTLAGLVSEICERAGIPFDRYDVRKLDGFVTGFQLTAAQPAFTHVRSLAEMYFFDPSSVGGKQGFVPRGGDSVATISPDDIIGDLKDDQEKRDGVIPRVVHLQYYDLEGQLEPDKQSSDRSIYIREQSEISIATSVVLETDTAARIATIVHKVMIEEQRGEIEFSLPAEYLKLSTGDIVTLNNDRLRISSVSLDDGMQHYKCSFDRRSAYYSDATGLAPVKPAEISLVPGDTTMEFIDIPILQSADDSLGYYFAITGASGAWKGAQVELSVDGGANYISSTISNSLAVLGETTIAMGNHRAEVPDYTNSVQVQLISQGVSLEPATLAEMLNRKNRAIIGNEIICFSGATEVGDGLWDLSVFLRGRLHTAPAAHAIGERFVLLETAFVPFVAAEIYQIGDDLTFRATSLNSTTQSTITETFGALSQTEPPPGFLRARRSGSNIVIDWIGTGVKGGKASVLHSDAFTGYRVTVNGTPTDTTAETLTVADPGGSVTIQVQQLNSITGPGQIAAITI